LDHIRQTDHVGKRSKIMDANEFDALARTLPSGSRRHAVRLLAALPLGVMLTSFRGNVPDTTAKKGDHGRSHRHHRHGGSRRHRSGTDMGTGKKKVCQTCCREDGSACTKKSEKCKPSLCQSASPLPLPLPTVLTSFTVEARWTNTYTDHDTFLFVPNEAGSTLPSPYIDYSCNPADSPRCADDVYPFTCVSQDATGPGDEVTTVRKLLAGRYEYWIELYDTAPAGDVVVNLRDTSGTILHSWSSPANLSTNDAIGWHVFDLDGGTGIVASVDQPIDTLLPRGAHIPFSNVCP